MTHRNVPKSDRSSDHGEQNETEAIKKLLVSMQKIMLAN